MRRTPRGPDHYARNLGFTPDEVRYIRNSPLRHFEIAKEFGTSSACILNMRKRVTHKHIE